MMKPISRILTVTTLIAFIVLAPPSFGQYAGIAKYREHERNVSQHLAKLDTLDFLVLTHREWDRLKESHANNIVVHWPDGRKTKGLAKHVDDLKAAFAYAPDARIKAHSVKFGSRDWTCVIGEMEGTFTKPMSISHGKQISPTRRGFKIRVCAVSHWNKKGLIDEEYLFWDNEHLMQQIGAAK